MSILNNIIEVIGENIKWLLAPIISVCIFIWSARKNKKSITLSSLEALLNTAIREIYELSEDSIEFVSNELQKHNDYKDRYDLLDKMENVEYYCACLNNKIYDFKTFKRIITSLFDRNKLVDQIQKVMNQYKEKDFRNTKKVIKKL